MYFHTHNAGTITRLRIALEIAEKDDRRLRLKVDEKGRLSYKVGEGMWSEPIEGNIDPYRDKS